MTTATVYLTIKTKAAEWDIEVEAYGWTTTGGGRPGDDELGWAEVDDVDVTKPNGDPLPRRIKAALTPKDWEAIEDALLENHGDW